MKRRAAIEPIIGHMKSEHRPERNRLKGSFGNAVNASLSAAAVNFGKLLKWVGQFWLPTPTANDFSGSYPPSVPSSGNIFSIDEVKVEKVALHLK